MTINVTLLVRSLVKCYNEPRIIKKTDDIITYDTDEGFVIVDIKDNEIVRIYSSIEDDNEPESYIQYYPPEF